MNNIYVENYNLPESCWKCECLKDGDETGFYCSLSAFDNNEDYREVDVRHPKCPLKSISTKLAEERKKVVQEIREPIIKSLENGVVRKDPKSSNRNLRDIILFQMLDILDQIERGK